MIQERQGTRTQAADEELVDVLTAISVVSMRLARKLTLLEQFTILEALSNAPLLVFACRQAFFLCIGREYGKRKQTPCVENDVGSFFVSSIYALHLKLWFAPQMHQSSKNAPKYCSLTICWRRGDGWK